MNKIRDLIYNISDILVTLVIITAALVLIGWRVSAIMEYGTSGSSLSSDLSDAILSHITSFTDSDNDAPEPAGSEAGDASDADGAKDSPAAGGQDTDASDSPAAEAWRFTVNNNESAESIAASLESSGIIPDQAAFLDVVYQANADTRLKAGTFSIPRGATSEEILSILTS